jgi:hypothetical protein
VLLQEKYDKEIQKSHEAANKYGAKRWDFVLACENVAAQREIDLESVLAAMIGAQKEVADTQVAELTAVEEAAAASAAVSEKFHTAFRRGQQEQEHFRTRLGLHAQEICSSGVEWCAKTRRAEGMMFTLPVRKAGAKPNKSAREVWLPVWSWVETDWQTFNFNAEWQGPIPGMSKADRDQFVLSQQLDLDKCTARGLDGEGLPPMGKNGRIFTFEVNDLLLVCSRVRVPDAHF